MAAIAEDQLSRWTQPAYENEDARAANTEKLIREAIKADDFLSGLGIDVFAKGSYKNNTNVRRDSDVDVAVEYNDIIYNEYASGSDEAAIKAARGFTPYSGPFRNAAGETEIGRFKDAVGVALERAFGSAAVSRSNKVFTVRESSRSLAADVVPCAQFRMHWSSTSYARGIRLIPDRSQSRRTVNYPLQHYRNGIQKNEDTSKRFKRCVRILKNLENKMVQDGVSPVVASYLIESLVYNCPESAFEGATWIARIRSILHCIWEETKPEVELNRRWYEVNSIKYLFHENQRWTRDEARSFAHAAWQYVS